MATYVRETCMNLGIGEEKFISVPEGLDDEECDQLILDLSKEGVACSLTSVKGGVLAFRIK